jgi:hypothetical protein
VKIEVKRITNPAGYNTNTNPRATVGTTTTETQPKKLFVLSNMAAVKTKASEAKQNNLLAPSVPLSPMNFT